MNTGTGTEGQKMRRKRRNHSASFIAIRGEKTFAERTQQYDVHPIRTRIDEAGWWATPTPVRLRDRS